MCLTIKNRFFSWPIPMVAEHNLGVFKVAYFNTFEKYYRTPYQGKRFDMGRNGTAQLNSEGILEVRPSIRNNVYCVHRGIHSFYDENDTQDCLTAIVEVVGYEKRVLKAYIPKGAQYFIGCRGEMVSTELIILDQHKDWKDVEDLVPAANLVEN